MNKNKLFDKEGKTIVLVLFVLVIVGLIVLSSTINNLINKQLADDEKVPVTVKKTEKKEIIDKSEKKLSMITRLEPNRQYFLHTVSLGREEIASFKSKDRKVFDLVGKVPDGKIEFKNLTDNTRGEEEWRSNLRNGMLKEYYGNDNIKLEVYYVNGSIRKYKEYFYDGILRKEVDYSDALRFVKNEEVGVGKLYGGNGNLTYEWNLTYEKRGGYDRTYNSRGDLIIENIFDDSGQIIETKNFMKQ